MSSAIAEISDYWSKNGKLDTERAFTKTTHAVEHICQLVDQLPSRGVSNLVYAVSVLRADALKNVGKNYGKSKGSVVGIALDGTGYLVLVETSPARRNRIYIRHGFQIPLDEFPGQPSESVDVTEYWRRDNVVRRDIVAVDLRDVIAFIRREAKKARSKSGASERTRETLLEISNTCIAVEHNFFDLIGRSIVTNNRSPDAPRGPLPKEGDIVAVLSEGKGLALSSSVPKARYGFVVGHKRMAQIKRDLKS